jgi:hypothetical protein
VFQEDPKELHEAILKKEINKATILIDQKNIDLNGLNESKLTPLQSAALNGCI